MAGPADAGLYANHHKFHLFVVVTAPVVVNNTICSLRFTLDGERS